LALFFPPFCSKVFVIGISFFRLLTRRIQCVGRAHLVNRRCECNHRGSEFLFWGTNWN
jgi:hypothetical protein